MSGQAKKSWTQNKRDQIAEYIRGIPNPDITDEHIENIPMRIDEDFGKAKRNLMWGSTLAIALGLADYYTAGPSCLNSPLSSGAGLPLIVLQFGATIYTGYFFFGFWYQASRVIARNANIFVKVKDNQLNRQLDEFKERIKNVADTLVEQDYVTTEEIRDDLQAFNDQLNLIAPMSPDKLSQYQSALLGILLEVRAETAKLCGVENTDKLDARFNEIEIKAKELLSDVDRSAHESLLKFQDFGAPIGKPSSDSMRIGPVLDRIESDLAKMQTDIDALSNELRLRDTNNFWKFDVGPSGIVFVVAIVMFGWRLVNYISIGAPLLDCTPV